MSHFKVAQAFAHLPPRNLARGISDELLAELDRLDQFDQLDQDAILDCWDTKSGSDGGASTVSEEPQPGPAPSGEQSQSVAVTFLEKLRPGGPWMLIAIVPDGRPTAVTAHTADQIEAFIREHNGKRTTTRSTQRGPR
jgi:hypothetical protein